MSSENIAYQQGAVGGPHSAPLLGDDISEKLGKLDYEVERRPTRNPPQSSISKGDLIKLLVSQIIAIICVIGGIYLAATLHNASYAEALNDWEYDPSDDTDVASIPVRGLLPIGSPSPHSDKVIGISFIFSLIATIATELIGSVHSKALRSALVAERRLKFNTNSRLFTAAQDGHWASPNGRLMNGLMAFLLILSYASASLIIIRFNVGDETVFYQPWLTAPPLIVLGISFILQGAIAFWGAHSCRGLMDCSSALVTAKHQVDSGVIDRVPGRCMVNISESEVDPLNPLPRQPLARQPSAWSSHPMVKRAAVVTWSLVPIYVIWGGIVYALAVNVGDWKSSSNFETTGTALTAADSSWAFSPNDDTQAFSMEFWGETFNTDQMTDLPLSAWPVILIVLMLVQSGLTLALHSCEAIINTTRDEHNWRTATRGAAVEDPGLIAGAIGSWRSLLLFGAKPFLHWMFGLSFSVVGIFSTDKEAILDNGTLLQLTVTANCPQTWYLSIALVVLGTITTIIATYNPRGPQPAAYGHFQTLANLIDDWEPSVIYWGQKADDKSLCHAGTSGQALPQPSVQEARYFAGEGTPYEKLVMAGPVDGEQSMSMKQTTTSINNAQDPATYASRSSRTQSPTLYSYLPPTFTKLTFHAEKDYRVRGGPPRATGYENAIRALEECKVRYEHPAEMRGKVTGVGPTTIARLVEELEKYCERKGIEMPELPVKKKAAPKAKAAKPKASRATSSKTKPATDAAPKPIAASIAENNSD
ncbi:hypothetical protein HWV62_35160 [Athelia sp. TMB]|nr:hypothetical protein HWV62_35160 [Athelia sp. TMB]